MNRPHAFISSSSQHQNDGKGIKMSKLMAMTRMIERAGSRWDISTNFWKTEKYMQEFTLRRQAKDAIAHSMHEGVTIKEGTAYPAELQI